MFNLSDAIEKVEETLDLGDMDLSKILNSDFIQKYTKFANVTEFLKNSGLPVDLSALSSLPVDKLDDVVKKASEFSSWKEMIAKASSEFFNK